MLALLVVQFVTLPIGIGAILLLIVGIWAIVDAFLIPGMIRKHKDTVRQNLSMQALVTGGQLTVPDMSRWTQADRDRYMRERSV